MAVRVDRLDAVASELARLVESTPLRPGDLPPPVATVARAASMVGVNLEGMARQLVANSLRSLTSRVSADPARADAAAAWLAHLLAWVCDERDDPPPAELPL